MLQLWQGTAVRGIDCDQLLRLCKIHRRGNDLVDVPHRLGTQSFWLPFGLNPVHSTSGQQLFVEFLQFQGGQLV